MRDDWFEEAWKQREDVLYPELFGSPADKIYPIPGDVFTNMFKQESFDPRWLHTGVFEFLPTADRSSWTYVSSGLSNEWWAEAPDPKGDSGIGNEFILELPFQAEWAILRLLHVCAFQILLAHDRYEGRDILTPYDRLPLRGPIGDGPSELTHLLVVPSVGMPETSQLGTGVFYWNHVLGITEAEAAFARNGQNDELLKLLAENGWSRITDPSRCSLVGNEGT